MPIPLSQFMERKAVSAVFLTLIMLLSGCLGSEETEKEVVESVPEQQLVANFSLVNSGISTVGDIVLIDGLAEVSPIDSEYFIEYDIITPSGIRPVDATFTKTDTGMRFLMFFIRNKTL